MDRFHNLKFFCPDKAQRLLWFIGWEARYNVHS